MKVYNECRDDSPGDIRIQVNGIVFQGYGQSRDGPAPLARSLRRGLSNCRRRSGAAGPPRARRCYCAHGVVSGFAEARVGTKVVGQQRLQAQQAQ